MDGLLTGWTSPLAKKHKWEMGKMRRRPMNMGPNALLLHPFSPHIFCILLANEICLNWMAGKGWNSPPPSSFLLQSSRGKKPQKGGR
jgi:hypothetical protein